MEPFTVPKLDLEPYTSPKMRNSEPYAVPNHAGARVWDHRRSHIFSRDCRPLPWARDMLRVRRTNFHSPCFPRMVPNLKECGHVGDHKRFRDRSRSRQVCALTLQLRLPLRRWQAGRNTKRAVVTKILGSAWGVLICTTRDRIRVI